MGWTKDQEKAIYTSGHNIIVSAGAGSGKTAVLSERVLEFVKKGYKASEFLILTFTNLAAGEMKHRIRKKLKDANLEEANNIDTSDICTFDSFASSIVKKYHFLLGLSPKLGNIDSNVMSVYKRNIVEEIFNRNYLNKNPKFEKMILDLCYKDDKELKDLVLRIHSLAELEIDKEKYLDSFIEHYYSKDFVLEFITKLENLLVIKKDGLLNAIYNIPDIPIKKNSNDTLNSVTLESAKELIEARSYNQLISGFNSLNFPRWPKNHEEESKEDFELAKSILKSIKEKYLKYFPNDVKEIKSMFSLQKEYAEVLIEITKELDRRQWEYKLEKQVFEFIDIAKFALKLVKENQEIQEELKAKYKMIMIDEYQDTSLLQEEFISYIENNNVYMVGDIKQSIYAFRNARSDIFKGKYDLYKTSKIHEAIDMKMNFRSRKEVLDDINTIFSSIMSDELGGANYIKDHMIDFGNQDYLIGLDRNQKYQSEFILYEGTKAQENQELEIRIIAEDIISKINNHYQVFVPGDPKEGILPSTRDITFKDFCILMDRGKQFELYRKIFTQYKIPLYVEQDEDIKENVIVKLLRYILILIKSIMENDYSSSDFVLAFLSISRSFILELNDEEIYKIIKGGDYSSSNLINLIKNIISSSSNLSNYLLVERVLDELKVYSKLVLIGNVKKNEIYLDEFMKYFKQMSDLDYSINDFITYLEYVDEYGLKITLSSIGSSLNSVRIMNIHKSKGLEFPLIYFPGLDVKFNKMEEKSKYSVCSRFGLIFPNNENLENGPVRILENYYKNLDDLSERIRLLYVSLTRAREKMIFVFNKKVKEKEVIDAESFGELLLPLINKFTHYEYIPFTKSLNLRVRENNIIHKKLDVRQIDFDLSKVESKRASKDLKLGTNKDLLELGTHLHEILEVIDFVNPDYSIISNNYHKSKIQKFLESELLKDVSKARIYKEYEFINQEYRGIIDLMLIYQDHIDIIDYKTKNIDDNAYNDQLEVYRQYISTILDLPINLYLYSIIDSTYRKVN